MGRFLPAGRFAARLLLAGALALGALLPCVRAGDEDAAPLRAGFATVDLTPDRPVPLGGYAARLGLPSTGVHDAIEARALVLEQGAARLGLVAIDTVGVSDELRRLLVRRTHDLDLDDVILAATHTHAGPGALTDVPLWQSAMGTYDARLLAFVAARIEAALRRAAADLTPVVLDVRRIDASGLARNRRIPGGPVDDTAGVVSLRTQDGGVRGLVVHFAAHPILVPHTERRLSAGWPGALRRSLEATYPEATCLFLQGAVGDVSPQVPRHAPRDTFGRVQAYGQALAECIRAGLARPAAAPTPQRLVVHGTRTVELHTAAGVLLGRQGASALAPARPFALPVARFTLGSVDLVTVPGEPTQGTARVLGQGKDRWVVGCAQGHYGYFADRALFRRGDGYEAEMSFFGPDAAERLAGGERIVPTPPPGPPHVEPPASPVVLRASGGPGGPRALGHAHGQALGPLVRDLLLAAEASIVREAMRQGAGVKLLPLALLARVSPRHLVVPALIRAARKLQPFIPPEQLDEMEGLAEAAGVPYDAILLENVFLTLAEQEDPGALLDLPARCTNAVVGGEATSMGQLFHLSTLDWGMREVLGPRALTLVVEPPEGHPFVSVTWPGMVGTLRAMGAQGIAITEESCAAPGDTRSAGIPVNLLMRQVVQHADGLDDAVRQVQEAEGTCGYKITISDGRALDARVVEVTATRSHVRRPQRGLLFGCDPDAPPEAFLEGPDPAIRPNDGSSARRYPVLQRRLEAEHGRLRAPRLLDAITTREGGIRSRGTLLACAFEPQTGRYWTAFRPALRAPGDVTWGQDGLFAHLSPEARRRYQPPWPVEDAGPVTSEVRLPMVAGVRVETVRFPSPVRSGSPGNDEVEAELFLPEDPVGAVIQLPHWKEPRGAPGQRLIALALAREGFAVLLLPLPWQYSRAPEGVASGAWTLSSNLARTREAAFQSAAEIVRAGRWLEEERGFPPSRQGLVGVSLGGHLASLALGAYPDRFQAGVFLLAASDVAQTLLRRNGVTDGVRKRLIERGVTVAEARTMLDAVDPARFARPEMAAGVLLVAGDEDPVTPARQVEALAEAWGGARIYTFPGGHYGIVRHLPSILVEVTKHLRKRFEDS